MTIDVLVVGAGFAGCVVAERCASAGKSVILIDKRSHIGGNAYDELDQHGILIHRYGPHIFHTNASYVAEYLSRFADWIPYEHRVLADIGGELYPLPINQTTINRLYRLNLDEPGIAAFLERVREPRSPILSSEDLVLSSVGRNLCETFFRGYTRKQWGLDLSELDATVAARLPIRTNTDDRYFTDEFQQMPKDGFTRMFERMIDHPGIEIGLDTEFHEERKQLKSKKLVYTGPIDRFFDYRFGPLPYRSLRFEHEHMTGLSQFQPVGTVNYPNEHAFTRITEFKHLTSQIHTGTSIVREYPQTEGEPYYPVPRQANRELFGRYHELSLNLRDTYFVGRLAQYHYYNMDQVVAAALKTARQVLDSLSD